MDSSVAIILAIIFGVLLIVFLVSIWWMIFKKAGYGGPMGLLMFIPFVNFIMLLILAYSKWPVLKQLEQYKQQLSVQRQVVPAYTPAAVSGQPGSVLTNTNSCPSCGAQVKATNNFCPSCGENIKG